MEFKYRIRDLRRESGMSAEELGKKLGVSRSAISNWENGNNQPNNSLLIELSKIFDCSIDFLLGNSDTRRPSNDNFQFAFSDYDKLTDDQKEIIKNLAASLIAQNEKK